MLDGQVVVVTGGAGLLGQEFALSIAKNNGTAVIADFDIERAKSAASRLNADLSKGKVDAVNLDITNTNSVLSCIEKISQRHGRIHAVVNNAYPRNEGYGRHFFDVDYSDFCENLNLNIGGYFLVSQKFGAYFKSIGGGNIVNIASIYGVIAPKFEVYNGTKMTMPVEYAAIKSAVLHLTEYMAKYLRGYNIRVNAISPGGILDDQPGEFLESYARHCLNKGMLDKSDVCGTLVYLLSEMSEFVNGQNIIVDDGFTI